MVATATLLRSLASLVGVGLLAGSAGCGGILKDEKDGGGACEKNAKVVPAVNGDCTVAQTHGCDEEENQDQPQTGDDEADTGGASPNGEQDKAEATDLPFNKDEASALTAFLLDVAGPGSGASMPADPVPGPQSPGLPFPSSECHRTEATTTVGTDTDVGQDYALPYDDGCMTPQLTEDTSSGGAAMEPNEMPPATNGGRCAADATQTKNVKLAGTDEASSLEWKALDGLQYYQDGIEACGSEGEGWHMAEAAELDKLFQVQGFQVQGETEGCMTSFWAAGATENGAQCTAGYRGFRWANSDPSTLPINANVVARNEAGSSSVYDKHSVLCVRGRLKPTEQCGVAVAQLFAQKPLGVVDLATGKTWAKITIRDFQDSSGVEAQCAKGASAGWRIPTRAELEKAIQNDTFKTVAYDGADTTCPKVWYQGDADGARACASTAVGTDGVVTLLADDLCAPAVAELIPAVMPTGNTNAVYGLCVQDAP